MLKYLVLVLAVVGTQGSPMPQTVGTKDARLIDDIILSAIEELTNQIKEAGLDPFVLESIDAAYIFPIPDLFGVSGAVNDLLVTGISDIVINDVRFNLLTLRLTLDIELPKIYFSVGRAAAELNILGNNLSADIAGSVTITRPRVSGAVQMKIGLGGIAVNTVDLRFTLGGLFSLLDVNLLGYNISAEVNELISVKIPADLDKNQNAINELINLVVKTLLESVL